MGSRSGIGLLEDGKIKAVYCHWDGYISHNGRILEESYRDVEKVKQLLALGDLSALRAEIGAKFDVATDCCIFYGRDREETGTEAQIYNNAAEMCEAIDGEYFYIMKNGVWFVSDSDSCNWTLLSVALAELGDDE